VGFLELMIEHFDDVLNDFSKNPISLIPSFLSIACSDFKGSKALT